MDGRREETARLARGADRIVTLILTDDYPDVDIAIERARLRELAGELFPGRDALFDMIYASRFDRITDQFREGGGV